MVFPEDSATCLYASSWHWIVDRVIEFLVVHVNYVLFLVTPGTPAGWNFEACILKYRWNLAATSLADRWNLEATSIKKRTPIVPRFFCKETIGMHFGIALLPENVILTFDFIPANVIDIQTYPFGPPACKNMVLEVIDLCFCFFREILIDQNGDVHVSKG